MKKDRKSITIEIVEKEPEQEKEPLKGLETFTGTELDSLSKRLNHTGVEDIQCLNSYLEQLIILPRGFPETSPEYKANYFKQMESFKELIDTLEEFIWEVKSDIFFDLQKQRLYPSTIDGPYAENNTDLMKVVKYVLKSALDECL